MDIAARDEMIITLQKELEDRKSLINERYKHVQSISKDNEFLEKVAGDYYNHYEAIKKIKTEQMRSMTILIDYLDSLIRETNSTEETLTYAKNQQSKLLDELNILNNEIDNLSDLTDLTK